MVPQPGEWFHSLGEIFTSLSDAGLRTEFLHEHKVLAWRGVRSLVTRRADILPSDVVF
jgi:hypothetical protein